MNALTGVVRPQRIISINPEPITVPDRKGLFSLFRSLTEDPLEGLFMPLRRAGIVLDRNALVGAGFVGLLVIGDIHGNVKLLRALLDWAKSNHFFVVQTGDLVDRGDESPECVELILRFEAEGLGCFLLGNHEVKLVQYAVYGSNFSEERETTLRQFKKYSGGLLREFLYRVHQGPVWARFENHFFVHAAFDERMLGWNNSPPTRELLKLAVIGPGSKRERRSRRFATQWIDQVPDGLTVVVGHQTTRSGEVEPRFGQRGGRVIFADTGAWCDSDAALPVVEIPFD